VPQAVRPVARSPVDATRKLKGRRYLLTADLEREFKSHFRIICRCIAASGYDDKSPGTVAELPSSQLLTAGMISLR
jgi:hypothetical protein